MSEDLRTYRTWRDLAEAIITPVRQRAERAEAERDAAVELLGELTMRFDAGGIDMDVWFALEGPMDDARVFLAKREGVPRA